MINLKKIFNFIVFSIVIFLTYKFLSNSYFELEEITKNLNYTYLILSICSFIICKIVGAYSLLILFNYNQNINFKYWCHLTFNSQFLNTIPFLGFAYKGLKLKKKNNINYFNYLYLYYFSTIIDFIITFLIISIFYFLPQQFEFYNYKFFMIILLLLFIFIMFLLSVGKFKFLFKYKFENFIMIYLKKKYSEFLKIDYIIAGNKILVLRFITFRLIEYLFGLLSFYFIFFFLNINLSFIQISLIYFLFIAMTNIRIFPQNYGVNELVGSFLIAQSYIGFAVGYVVMIFFRIIDILSLLILMIILNSEKFLKFFKNNKN